MPGPPAGPGKHAFSQMELLIRLLLVPLALGTTEFVVINITTGQPRNRWSIWTTTLMLTVLFTYWWLGLIVWLAWQATWWGILLAVIMTIMTLFTVFMSALDAHYIREKSTLSDK
jgi:hypothetical protein